MKRLAYPFFVIIIATSVSILAINIFQDILWPPPIPEVNAEPSLQGGLQLDLQPVDTVGWLSGQTQPLSNQKTINLDEGLYQLTLVAPGYSTQIQPIEIHANQKTVVSGSLIDEYGPQISLSVRPAVVRTDETLTLEATLQDEGSGVKSYEFRVDGIPLKKVVLSDPEAIQTYALPLSGGLAVGLHEGVVRAIDGGQNRSEANTFFEIKPAILPPLAQLPAPGEVSTTLYSPTSPVTTQLVLPYPMTLTLNQTLLSISAATTTTSAAIGPQPATIYNWGDLTIPTYGYEQALTYIGGFPYPVLDKEIPILEATPKQYKQLVIENDVLRLRFLPELGGRLYQITDKVTGQDLLYNNEVIKPTKWGPEIMNWWLAVGGMEWAYPVEEHGYAWAQAWSAIPEIDQETGAVSVRLNHQDQVTGLRAEIIVTLPHQGASFDITLSLHNPTQSPAEGQLWRNTALVAGPQMKVDLPAQFILIHNLDSGGPFKADEVIPWQNDLAAWGRWQELFSAFVEPPYLNNAVEVRSEGASIGLRRTVDPEKAPGVKVFMWGENAPLDVIGGTQVYYEIWGGLTPTFDHSLTIHPQETVGWIETWTLVY